MSLDKYEEGSCNKIQYLTRPSRITYFVYTYANKSLVHDNN